MNTKTSSYYGKIFISLLTVIQYGLVSLVLPTSLSLLSAQSVEAQSQNESHISRLHFPLRSGILIVEKSSTQEKKRFLVSDYLSSTKVIIDENGSVITIPQFYPYGSAIENLSLDKTNKYYTGQKKVTDESDLYNYNARYYNPETGIFIQPDSVKGPHRYSYGDDDPAMLNDPTGRCPTCIIGAAIGGGLDLAVQMMLEGKSLNEVNWASVAVSAVGGAVGIGIGEQLGKLALTTGAKVVATATADYVVGVGTTVVQSTVTNVNDGDLGMNIMEAAVSNLYGMGIGAAGGKVASKVGNIASELFQDAGIITLGGLKQAERGGVNVRMMRKGELKSHYSPGHGEILTQDDIAGVAFPGRNLVLINPNTSVKGSTILHEVSGHMLGKQRYMSPSLIHRYPLELIAGLEEIEAYYYQARNIRGALQAHQGQLPLGYEQNYKTMLEHAIGKVRTYQLRALQLIGENGFSHDILRNDFGPMYDYLQVSP